MFSLKQKSFSLSTPKSDKQVVSPNSITLESHIKVTRIQEMIPNLRNSWLDKSYYEYHRKCIENSMENLHTDFRT